MTAAKLQEAAAKLSRAIVDERNAEQYRTNMQALLELTAQRESAQAHLDLNLQPTYLLMVKSVAWQESCWRQFIRVNNRVRWLESSTGDIGLMQVNKHVWRGFYNLKRLQWDILYNAGAGADILTDLMQTVMEKPRMDPVQNYSNLARSVYAAYNGGPSAFNRWRKREDSDLRETDDAFLSKYQALQHGHAIDVLSCAAQWGKSPGH